MKVQSNRPRLDLNQRVAKWTEVLALVAGLACGATAADDAHEKKDAHDKTGPAKAGHGALAVDKKSATWIAAVDVAKSARVLAWNGRNEPKTNASMHQH